MMEYFTLILWASRNKKGSWTLDPLGTFKCFNLLQAITTQSIASFESKTSKMGDLLLFSLIEVKEAQFLDKDKLKSWSIEGYWSMITEELLNHWMKLGLMEMDSLNRSGIISSLAINIELSRREMISLFFPYLVNLKQVISLKFTQEGHISQCQKVSSCIWDPSKTEVSYFDCTTQTQNKMYFLINEGFCFSGYQGGVGGTNFGC